MLSGGAGYCYACIDSPVCSELLDGYADFAGCFYTSSYESPGVHWGVCPSIGYFATGPDTDTGGYSRCVRTDG